METTREASPDEADRLRAVHMGGSNGKRQGNDRNTDPPGVITFAPTVQGARALTDHDVISPWRDHFIWLHHCSTNDANALQDWTDAALREDYYFKKGHWMNLLVRPQVQVYAIAVGSDPASPLWATAGLVIVYHNTRLLNLYVAKEYRSMALGTEVMRTISPNEVRAKTDMTAGDPTPFYERLGYEVQQQEQGPNGTISIMRKRVHASVPWLNQNGK